MTAVNSRAYGIDVSHWNDMTTVATMVRLKRNIKFMMCKASEGATMQDSAFLEYIKTYCNDIVMGAYHYCRPDINSDPAIEVHNMLTTIARAGAYCDSIIPAVDWEGKSLGYEDWLESFVKVFYDNTGIFPVIYASDITFKNRFNAARHELLMRCPRWVARWGSGEFPAGMTDCTIHQYESGSLNSYGTDLNVAISHSALYNLTMDISEKRYSEDTETECCCACCKE